MPTNIRESAHTAQFADALNVPLLRDQLSATTLAQLNAVSKDVADTAQHSDQWRREFAVMIHQPLVELKEPQPGVSFKTLRYGHKASVKRACHQPLTPQEKSDLVAYRLYMRPDRPVDIESLAAADIPVPKAVASQEWLKTRKRIVVAGAAACLVSAGVLGTLFLSQVSRQG